MLEFVTLQEEHAFVIWAVVDKIAQVWKKNTYSITMFIFLQLILFSLSEFNCPGDGTCSNQGICDDSTGICNCDSGFEGQSCEGKMITLVRRIELQTPQKSAGGRIS